MIIKCEVKHLTILFLLDTMPCSALYVDRRFRGTLFLHLKFWNWLEQGTIMKAGGNQRWFVYMNTILSAHQSDNEMWPRTLYAQVKDL
jgi:hypothetical protein